MLFQAGISCQWTTDSQRLMLEHFDMINVSPSYIYHSALPLSPSSSWFHQYYSVEPLWGVKVVKGLLEWGACFHTVPMDTLPLALTYWKDTIAVGLTLGAMRTSSFTVRLDVEDEELGGIIILNAVTGSKMAVLSGHSN